MTFQTYPEQSQATTALILGILGFVLCGVLAPFAWSIGSKELAAIDNGLRDPANRGTANAGKILGIIGTIFLGIAAVLMVFFLLFVVVAQT